MSFPIADGYCNTGEHALVIDEEQIRAISTVLNNALSGEQYSDPQESPPDRAFAWTVQFSDKTEASDLDTEEVISLSNDGRRQIISLEASSKSGPLKTEVKIRGGGAPQWSASASGSDAMVAGFKEAIEAIMGQTRPWWSVFARVDFALYVLGSVFLAAIIRVGYVGVYQGEALLGPDSVQFPATMTALKNFGLSLFLACLLVSAVVDSLFRRHLFPKFSVLVGGGLRRAKSQRTRRLVVGSVLLLLGLPALTTWAISKNPIGVKDVVSQAAIEESVLRPRSRNLSGLPVAPVSFTLAACPKPTTCTSAPRAPAMASPLSQYFTAHSNPHGALPSRPLRLNPMRAKIAPPIMSRDAGLNSASPSERARSSASFTGGMISSTRCTSIPIIRALARARP